MSEDNPKCSKCHGQTKSDGVNYSCPLQYRYKYVDCGHVDTVEEEGGIPMRDFGKVFAFWPADSLTNLKKLKEETDYKTPLVSPAETDYFERVAEVVDHTISRLEDKLVTEELDPEKYKGTCGSQFIPAPGTSIQSIEVLNFLVGRKWDKVSLAYVSGLRPSSIRVTEGTCTLDSRPWRVTVFTDGVGVITKVQQEVTVSLPEKVVHGSALRCAFDYGIDSPECQWHNDDNITGYMAGIVGYHKNTKDEDGNDITVPFPTRDTPETQKTPRISKSLSDIHIGDKFSHT